MTFKELMYVFALPLLWEMDLTIQIFLSTKREVPLTGHEVLRFLSIYPPDLEQRYLEFLIENQQSEEQDHHTRLVCNYVDTILKLRPPLLLPIGVRVEAGKEEGLLGIIRRKLLKMLKSATYHFDVHHVLQKLHDTTLFEEMVVLQRKVSIFCFNISRVVIQLIIL